ncbi:protein of unknown function (plasmid) [Azospirillum lipoferum 4B]|uniref:Uncharacterized protein n=1 Tax=Azospirillum lipoferum (strain 4B) TaxID=862719 RepID=G7ZFA8_AZOL4|nr:protein of unknown function [Azospirillum lipoferum 4B]
MSGARKSCLGFGPPKRLFWDGTIVIPPPEKGRCDEPLSIPGDGGAVWADRATPSARHPWQTLRQCGETLSKD